MLPANRASWLVAALGWGLVVGTESSARAESPATETIRIDYRADPHCPTASEFQDRVFSRARAARPAVDSESARTFIVQIGTRAGGFQGSLSIRTTAALTVARTVVDARCEAVAEALALSAVLAIDPTPDLAADDRDSTSAAALDADADARAGKHEPAASPQNPRAALADDASTPAAASSRSAGGWPSALFLGADLQSGSSPNLTLGGSLGIELRPERTVRSLGVDMAFLRSWPERTGTASSSFELWLARPKLCALAAELSARARVMPCLAVELGQLTATGSDISAARSERRFWGALQLPARLEIELSASLLLELEASLLVPLTRYRFVFLEPKTSIYDVPPVGFAGGVRLGSRL